MIGAGFRLGAQSPESQHAKHSARVGRLAGRRLAPVRNWQPSLGEEKLPGKIMSSKSLSAPGFRSAFRCSQRSGVSNRSPVLFARAPPTPFVSASPPWRKCCVNVWVFQTPETHNHKQTEGQAPTRIGVKVSQPSPQVRARMYGCFKPLRRASASDADAATTVYVFTVQSPRDSGPKRRQDALLLRLSRSGRSAAQNCVAALPNVLWQQSLDASPDVSLSVSLHRRRSLPASSTLHLLERTVPCCKVT